MKNKQGNAMNEAFQDLTWGDLEKWAGTKILNRGKSYIKSVHNLATTPEGGLLAWVTGSAEYAVRVEIEDEEGLVGSCTCPYDWEPCKHAVAIVLAALERMKRNEPIPPAAKDDARLLALEETDDDEFLDDDDFDDSFDEDISEKPGRKSDALRTTLNSRTKDELVELVLELARQYPEVERNISEERQLQDGKVDALTRSLRNEIVRLTGEPAWHNPWKGEGNIPDYSHVRRQLAALLKAGHSDSVVDLGKELWVRGNEQVGQSHDEGDTAMQIGECMEIVFQAVASSSLAPHDRLLWMIDKFLEDEYAILDSCNGSIDDKSFTKAHWRDAARRLLERLDSRPIPAQQSFSSNYERRMVLNWVLTAFENGGQMEKVIPLLEKEAHACQCYDKLVDALLAEKRKEKAREWCIEGWRHTIKSAPGIAKGLQEKLRDLAQKEGRKDLVAAYRAQDFFERPSRATYEELRKSAAKMDMWPDVRAAVLKFLETGRRPDMPSGDGKKQSWPLPEPEVLATPDMKMRGRFPDTATLIDIAILEERLDDVVQLYGAMAKGGLFYHHGTDEAVAQAVSGTHPDVALDIWKRLAEGQINLVQPRAYDEAATYLRKMHKVYEKTGRLTEWRELLGLLRVKHKAKRRLMQVLDVLEGKRVID